MSSRTKTTDKILPRSAAAHKVAGRSSLGRLPEEVVNAGAGEEFVFIRRGEDAGPYVTGKIEVGRYLTLMNAAERQRRAAGRSH